MVYSLRFVIIILQATSFQCKLLLSRAQESKQRQHFAPQAKFGVVGHNCYELTKDIKRPKNSISYVAQSRPHSL